MLWIREINMYSICIRILLCVVVGGVLGIERGRKNRPAGFRTYILVCLGAGIVMMTNQYIYQFFHTSDPGRMGAQVISGIGFLGAGTIMVTGKSQIKGITTAAGLWTAACLGLAIGVGFYEGALLGGLSIFIIMTLLEKLEVQIKKRSSCMEVYLEFAAKIPLSEFLLYVREYEFEVQDIQISKNKVAKEQSISVVLFLKSKVHRTHAEMMDILSNAQGIQYIEEI